jgi:hypothetical protein
MEYDLGYFDLETRVLEPLENPFGPKVLPMFRYVVSSMCPGWTPGENGAPEGTILELFSENSFRTCSLLSSCSDLAWIEIESGFFEALTKFWDDFLHVVVIAESYYSLQVGRNLNMPFDHNRHPSSC